MCTTESPYIEEPFTKKLTLWEKSKKMAKTPLHTCKPLAKRWFNRIFALTYTCAIFALLYRHCLNIILSPTVVSISLLLADLVLAFLWATCQAFHLNPVSREVFPENLPEVAKESEYPALDVFICTADPFKEPPVGVINTALSVMAYDYPTDKLSLYVSDDGGSQLTLFAFMEAAKFARHWLPYCRKYDIADRSPEVYFRNDPAWFPETHEIKDMYESLKARVENVVDRGTVSLDEIVDDHCINAFRKWRPGSTRQNHPTVIEVLVDNSKDKDVTCHNMPNLFYISREKSKAKPHHFKAGALNVLVRVSATITNAPIFLVLDCDMYSNDPKTPLRTLCYILDPNLDSRLAFVQFPQQFHNINQNDTYGGEFKSEAQNLILGMDGLLGTMFLGTGGFFRRHTLFGSPSSVKTSEFKQVNQQRPSNQLIQSEKDLKLAYEVASCSYEENTKWGLEVGFMYGCLAEDVFTSFRMHCQGWKSVLCNPERAAFLGNSPMSLNDVLNQTKRWYMGFLEFGLSKYSPIAFGIRSMNPLQALWYAHLTFRSFWSIPVMIYAFLPQLTLMNSTPIFPKVSETWFLLYAFLFLGAYGKDLVDFMLAVGVVRKWWNNQRMWLIWGCSSYPFALCDWLLKSLGMSASEFNVTSKVSDSELSKRYEKGVFEFGVESPLFLPISVAAVVNLMAFLKGITQVFKNGSFGDFFVQIFIAGFLVINSWPIYEAMVLRSDKGKMPLMITLKSVGIAFVIYLASSLAF